MGKQGASGSGPKNRYLETAKNRRDDGVDGSRATLAGDPEQLQDRETERSRRHSKSGAKLHRSRSRPPYPNLKKPYRKAVRRSGASWNETAKSGVSVMDNIRSLSRGMPSIGEGRTGECGASSARAVRGGRDTIDDIGGEARGPATGFGNPIRVLPRHTFEGAVRSEFRGVFAVELGLELQEEVGCGGNRADLIAAYRLRNESTQ
ncbi:hypothetical protein K438DRAFT_1776441 [Mycena galopus ATCC 62051]|nr:hypothetical protein K438DRAFT_1776441 [Mycena galopus ATCC 62051]